MEIKTTIERIEKEMIDRGLLPRIQTKTEEEKIRYYFSLMYGAGFDEGCKQGSHRKQVAQYTMEGKLIKVFGSITEAANSVHRDKSAIQRCVSGQSEYSGGYKWKYIKDVTLEDCR